jgi:hypothetical protein
MSRWRVALILALVTAPFLFLAAVGAYYLWQSGHGWISWGIMAGCLALGYGLGWYWQHQRKMLAPVAEAAPSHWTDRDRAAWQLVTNRAKEAEKLDANRLSDVDHYVSTARDMALEIARFYHPGSADPISSLTVPEILTVIELASHDLAEIVDRYLPAGHLLTVRDWKRARAATDWYQSASNIYWLIAALFSPVNTGIRFAVSQVGLSTPWRMLQQNLILWFYTAYVHRLGNYLIELNSGRLRIGATRYQQLMGLDRGPAEAAPDAGAVKTVTLAILGQVKMGKSSFVNALLGEQLARTDIVPATNQVTRYQLQPEGIPSRLVILDTVGYAHEGPKADQLQVTYDTARQSDLVVLVVHARSPARQADLEMLDRLREWFKNQPDLRMPPILAALTHIDLLSPMMEWQPPYDWQNPKRPKEQQIAQAVQTVKDQLGLHLAGVIPVCTSLGKVFGVQEGFLPALSALLDEVHAVALLRCLRGEINAGKITKVFHQLLATGKQLVRVLWLGER